MNEAEYIEAVNRPGARQKFRYVKVDSPAREFKGAVTLTREVEFTGRTGVDYARLAVNAEREVQARKWGVRRNRWFVDHTPKSGPNKGVPTVYATVFAVPGTFRTTYFIDGAEATREAYNAFRTASAAKGSELDESGYMDIVLADLTALPSAAKVAAAVAA
jgi:hypothetical protein